MTHTSQGPLLGNFWTLLKKDRLFVNIDRKSKNEHEMEWIFPRADVDHYSRQRKKVSWDWISLSDLSVTYYSIASQLILFHKLYWYEFLNSVPYHISKILPGQRKKDSWDWISLSDLSSVPVTLSSQLILLHINYTDTNSRIVFPTISRYPETLFGTCFVDTFGHLFQLLILFWYHSQFRGAQPKMNRS